MKGLLRKDFYAIIAYFRAFFVICALFILAPLAGIDNPFALMYPCIFSGMTAMSLIAYEEREKWDIYAGTLPVTRAQRVSGKYITSLVMSVVTVVLILLLQLIYQITLANDLDAAAWEKIGYHLEQVALTVVPVALLPTALLLPFIFKWGAEKGRLVYYVVLGFFCAAIAMAGVNGTVGGTVSLPYCTAVVVAVGSLALYALSWGLSIYLYKKRCF